MTRIMLITAIFGIFLVGICYGGIPSKILESKQSVVTVMLTCEGETISTGSGFATSNDGIVITNYHVIESYFKKKNVRINIKLENGKIFNVTKIVNFDEYHDVAKIKAESSDLLKLDLSRDTPKQGDDVYVIGSPMGLETTMSNGIISSIRGEDKFIQITAPISSGSSGSPVLNSSGQVIGIATLIMNGGQNLNFAIPVSYIDVLSSKKDMNIDVSSNPEKDDLSSSTLSQVYKKELYQFKQAKVELLAKSDVHTYVSFTENNKTHWLRLPVTSVKIGDVIKFPITPTQNYIEDKSLNLTFINISDVPSCEIISNRDYNLSDNELYAIAKKYSDEVMYEYAIEIYNILLNKEHNHVGYYNRSRCYYYMIVRSDNYDAQVNNSYCEKSLVDINKALAMASDDVLLSHRGRLYSDKNWCSTIANNQLAIKDYIAAIRIKPKGIYYHELASIYLTEKDFSNALKEIDNALLLENDNSYYSTRGLIQTSLGNYDKAINDYKAAVDLSLASKDVFISIFAPLNELASAYEKANKLDNGLQQFTKIIKKYPKCSSCYEARAELNDKNGSADKAISDYSAAINIVPTYSNLYLSRGRIYYKNNKYNLAWLDMKKGCELSEDPASDVCKASTFMNKLKIRGFNWEYILTSGVNAYFLDNKNIKKINNRITDVWIKLETSDITKTIADKKQINYNDNYDNYSHTLVNWRLNCVTSQLGIISYIDYAVNGAVIYSHSNKQIDLEDITPETAGEEIYKKVCKSKVDNVNRNDNSKKKRKNK